MAVSSSPSWETFGGVFCLAILIDDRGQQEAASKTTLPEYDPEVCCTLLGFEAMSSLSSSLTLRLMISDDSATSVREINARKEIQIRSIKILLFL